MRIVLEKALKLKIIFRLFFTLKSFREKYFTKNYKYIKNNYIELYN